MAVDDAGEDRPVDGTNADSDAKNADDLEHGQGHQGEAGEIEILPIAVVCGS